MLPLLHPARVRVRPRRWMLGAGLSVGLHLAAIAAIGVSAFRTREEVPRFYGVDLARRDAPAGNEPEAVTVDVVADEGVVGRDLVEVPVQPRGAPERTLADAAPKLARQSAGSATGAAERGPRVSRVRGPRAAAKAPGGRTLAAHQDAAGAGDGGSAAETSARPDPAAAANHAARMAYRATLRRHLHEAWNASEVYLRIDPQGRLQGSLFTTAVQVRFRPDGSIADSALAESSGLPALDKEALGALKRLRPMPPLPSAMVDADGGWNVLCKFYLDVGMFRFAADIRRVFTEVWRPSRAFATSSEHERKTVLKLSVSREGTLVGASIAMSSGLDLLDENALRAAANGMRLPAPPPAFTREPGPATVFIAFLHLAGDVRVLKPREDVEEE